MSVKTNTPTCRKAEEKILNVIRDQLAKQVCKFEYDVRSRVFRNEKIAPSI